MRLSRNVTNCYLPDRTRHCGYPHGSSGCSAAGLLQGHKLATVAGAVGGVDAPEAFPTNGCRTLIGSFNGNCCNTKLG
jgi:hypothetical protein